MSQTELRAGIIYFMQDTLRPVFNKHSYCHSSNITTVTAVSNVRKVIY